LDGLSSLFKFDEKNLSQISVGIISASKTKKQWENFYIKHQHCLGCMSTPRLPGMGGEGDGD
jgi:hypothetical protein